MPSIVGRRFMLSPARRFVGDLVHCAGRVPSVPVQRRMDLAAVAAARERSALRPGWCVLFTKAYARVAARMAELRRAYLGFPRPHLYEHGHNVASVAVGRRINGEEVVAFGRLRAPDGRPLAEIADALRRWQTCPVGELRDLTRALALARWPRPLRRLRWWMGLNVSGAKRAHYFGTFGVSVYAGLGAASLHPLTPLTTTLNYGVVGADGGVDVRLVYDARVFDGTVAARALAALEGVLRTDIVAELEALPAARPHTGGASKAAGFSHAAR